MQLSYKFRLYPNKEQGARLLQNLDLCRWTYNYFLAQWQGEIPSRYKLQSQLPALKAEKPELNEVYAKPLQMVLHQLYTNLKALSKTKKKGRRVGRLRFKGKGWFKTLNFNQSGFKLIKTGNRLDRLHLSKIGDIPIRLHREIEGKIKGVIIKRYRTGEWFTIFQVEVEPKPLPQNGQVVGIDVGIKHFLTDSEGLKIENPKFSEKTYKRLRKEQKNLSRKGKSSKNRGKQKIRVAKVHEKIVNKREDFLHKLSRYYVDNYDFIAIEDLNIKNMIRNHRLSKLINDASWNHFIKFLSYKAENAGKIVVKVNPRGTSQECKFGKLDRDYNASLNILQRGLEKVGMGQPEVTPTETEPLLVRASSVIEMGSSLR